MGLIDLSTAAPQTEDAQGRRAKRLAALGVAGLLVVGAAKATRFALDMQSRGGAGGMVRMAAVAAEAAAEAATDGTFDAANSLVGPALTKFLQIAPVITCQLVAVSALKMCQDIKRVKTTATLNPMPFTAMLTNSVVWGLYGFGKGDITMLTPQVLSLVSGAYYTFVFHQYTKSGSDEKKTLNSHYIAGGLMSAVTLALAIIRPFDTVANPIRSYELCGQVRFSRRFRSQTRKCCAM